MRYISKNPNLTLYSRDGNVKHQFVNGVLTVGSLTTAYPLATNSIVATPTSNVGDDLAPVIKDGTDLKGFTTGACVEIAGQGALTGVTYASFKTGESLTALECGYRGVFFPAPQITPGATTVPATADIWYEVLSGSVTYAGVTYGKKESAGAYFKSDGSTTTTSGSGTFALTLPPALAGDPADQFRNEAFALTQLGTPDAVTGYWNLQKDYTPTDSLVSTDDTYFAYIK